MKKRKFQTEKKDYVISAAVFGVVFVVMSTLFLLLEQQAVYESKVRYRYIAANQAGVLQSSVDAVLSKANTLRSLLRTGGGDTGFFETEAPLIYEEAYAESGMVLKNIAVAPGGIVEKVYPLSGNESLVGFDFMDETKAGNLEAIAAYERGELVLTEPFELVQGGTGMAGRMPIFLEKDGSEEFWGLITVTMDFDTLLNSFRLQTLSDMGISYRLWYSGDDGSMVVLAGEQPGASDRLMKDAVSYEFSLSNLTWHLDVVPKKGWVDYSKIILELIVVFAVAVLLASTLLGKRQLHRANESLERLANLDGLTFCCSRHYVNSNLVNQRTGQWNDPHVKYSMAMIDIDYFKEINDTYGHENGDRAIIAVAQVLMDLSKQENGDCVIRYGGDEFVVLFNDVTKERFLEKLDAIVKQISDIRFADLPDLRLTVSVGGEFYISPQQSLYYEMITRADEKLYEAKEGGRNQYKYN